MDIMTTKLVITTALKAELPIDWLEAHKIPVLSYKKYLNIARKEVQKEIYDAGIVVVITGVGPIFSHNCAKWIKTIFPAVLYVVNIGSAGGLDKAFLGKWVTPNVVVNENGTSLKIDVRLPFIWPVDLKRYIGGKLLTVVQPKLATLPENWEAYQFVDMEAAAQAEVFKTRDIAFHLIKYITDDSSQSAKQQFKSALKTIRQTLAHIFNTGLVLKAQSMKQSGKTILPITVVIPVYNRAHCIAACVESVLSQTQPPEEVIVVDDGSKDDLESALKPFKEDIIIIKNKINHGVSYSRNVGIQKAKNPWLAFLDSDDLWEPKKLANQWKFHQNYPFYQISQNGEIWIRNGIRVNPKYYHIKPEGWIWSLCLHRCLISPSAVMIKKSLLAQVGLFDENLPACEDYDLWLRITREHVVGLLDDLSVIKQGGHKDQLSKHYIAMDRFRVESLLKFLENEENLEYRTELIAMIRKKSMILLKGYRKRQNDTEIEKYQRLSHIE
jgi:glycosyltransferase involved in cell wall biosynthesis/nucleoside phosphorylase